MLKALLIFIKNPQLGKVKTRLAKTVGDVNALKIYQYLLDHTMEITYELDTTDKFLYYNEFIPTRDEWPPSLYQKELQKGIDLNDKMLNAFTQVIEEESYSKAILISPDCYLLTDSMLDKAFKMLDTFDVVLGPSNDGGYYLIGMKKVHRELFEEDEQGESTNHAKVMERIKGMGMKVFNMPVLTDVDTEEDLGKLNKMIKVEEKPSRRKQQ
ncbi:MAG: TIGR04282 family arsenosugar biosynthesis glycosyltransferase [Bacteroidota bacterium]|nr:TIGR04282 family arsenosugar biosynthesis glycosyltransferase [Bacteroidota bacterium]